MIIINRLLLIMLFLVLNFIQLIHLTNQKFHKVNYKQFLNSKQ